MVDLKKEKQSHKIQENRILTRTKEKRHGEDRGESKGLPVAATRNTRIARARMRGSRLEENRGCLQEPRNRLLTTALKRSGDHAIL